MKLTVDAKIIRAAQANQANGDVRYYLCGIHFAANGDVVATDGHTLFKSSYDPAEIEDGEELDAIVHIDGKVPASAKTVHFDFVRMVAVCYTSRSQKTLAISFVDGKFPDYQRVIPTESKATETIGFRPEYLGRATVLGKDSVKYTFNGAGGSCLAEPATDDWPIGTLMVIMPTRLK